MARIVISYRRTDSAGVTGRIFDRLVAHFGADSVFMDVDAIPLGVDFRKYIDDVLKTTDVLLVVIGRGWLVVNEHGESRIMQITDPVRVEIETALRNGLTVIPVLVDGAAMPRPADLPETMQDFVFINAAEVSLGKDFQTHVDRLIRFLDTLSKPARAKASPAAQRKTNRMPIAIGAVGVAAIVAIPAGFALRGSHPAPTVVATPIAARTTLVTPSPRPVAVVKHRPTHPKPPRHTPIVVKTSAPRQIVATTPVPLARHTAVAIAIATAAPHHARVVKSPAPHRTPRPLALAVPMLPPIPRTTLPPIATVDQSTQRAAVLATITRSIEISITSVRTLNDAPLAQVFSGKALTDALASTDALRRRGLFAIANVTQTPDPPSLTIDADGDHARYSATYAFTADIYAIRTHAFVAHEPLYRMSRAVTLERRGAYWMIVRDDTARQ